MRPLTLLEEIAAQKCRERNATHKVVFRDGSEKKIYKGEINQYKGNRQVELIISIL